MSLKSSWHLRDPGAVAAPWKYQVLAPMAAASKLLKPAPPRLFSRVWVRNWGSRKVVELYSVLLRESKDWGQTVIRQTHKLDSLTSGSSSQPNICSIKHLEWESFLWVSMTQATSDKRKFTVCELKVISVPNSPSLLLPLPCTPAWLCSKGIQCWAKLPCFLLFCCSP